MPPPSILPKKVYRIYIDIPQLRFLLLWEPTKNFLAEDKAALYNELFTDSEEPWLAQNKNTGLEFRNIPAFANSLNMGPRMDTVIKTIKTQGDWKDRPATADPEVEDEIRDGILHGLWDNQAIRLNQREDDWRQPGELEILWRGCVHSGRDPPVLKQPKFTSRSNTEVWVAWEEADLMILHVFDSWEKRQDYYEARDG